MRTSSTNLSDSKIFFAFNFYNKMYHKFKRELILKTFSVVLLQGWMVCANMCFVNHLNLQSQFLRQRVLTDALL